MPLLDKTHWKCLACETEFCTRSEAEPCIECECGTEASWVRIDASVWSPGNGGEMQSRAVRADSIAELELSLVPSGNPELDELLCGGFVVGSSVLVHGRRGGGKSRSCYRWASQSRRCLIVHGEMTAPVVVSILRSLGAPLSAIHLYPEANSAWQQEATRIAAETVVIDSLNSFEDPLNAHGQARRWAQRSGALVYCISQSTKSGDHRGSSQLAHDCDYELRIERPAPNARASKCEVKKTRMGPCGVVTVPLA